MSLKFIPSNNAAESVQATSYSDGAPSVKALPDTLRNGGHVPIASQINNKHALQQRLENWEDTQVEFKLESMRRLYGPGEPIRRTMEMKIVDQTDSLTPQINDTKFNIHHDILYNKEFNVDWEDVYPDFSPDVDIHSAMGKRMGI